LAEVTVTEYVPARLVEKLAVIWPLLHWYVTASLDVALTVTAFSVQFSGPVLLTVTVGVVTSC
jgi:hypothetical protein